MVQQALPLPRRGGARKGAGRKRKDGRAARGVVHLARPRLDGRTPVHVTLRLRRDVPNLRSQRCMSVAWRVFAAARDRLGMRLVHWAVQRDHLHLVVEPESGRALSRAMQGLCIRFAKQLNRELRRRGQVFADRYHEAVLDSPRRTRHALAYVLLQERHHARQRGEKLPVGLDACSSAPTFDGWTVPCRPRPGPWTATVMPAATWLLGFGWTRHGLVDPCEVPGFRRRRLVR
jgi:REP-associated tyrosine transposase